MAWQAGLAVVAGYLLGSVSFAVVLVRLAHGSDVRSMGSGNAGATNVLRSAGRPLALATLVLDTLKGVLPVLGCGLLGLPAEAQVAAGIAAVCGHVFPVWFGFRGGKGVATAGGAFLVLSPLSVVVLVAVFLVTVRLTRLVSLGSLVGAGLLPFVVALLGGGLERVAGGAAVTGVLLLSHRGNLRRLWSGTERRLGEKGEDS
jgi:glycerol-3-phosphate acyltransferase PlsY